MNKIPCEVIRDLLPSYIDELTSEVTNQVIRDHLEDCEDCRARYDSMHAAEEMPQPDRQEKKEIDFLKKNKKRNRRIIFGSIAGAVVLIAAVLCARVFLIGNGDERQWDAANLQVEGNALSFEAIPTDSASAIAGLTFAEEDGVISVKARSVLASPLYPGSRHGEYQAQEQISEIRIGDRIVWSEGATVSPQAAALFETRHAYVGDMPANQATANAMSMGTYLGVYLNELETDQEPYGWKITMPREFTESERAQKEQDMDAFGRVLIGLIGNLDHVSFEYGTANGRITRTITAADATDFLGEDIKNCGNNIRTLDTLLTKSGLNLYVRPAQEEEDPQNELWIQIINESDTEIQTFEFECFRDGESCSTGAGMNADNSAVSIGDSMWMSVSEQDFGGEAEGTSMLEMAVSLTTPSGEKIEIPEKLRITLLPGNACSFRLTGNKEEGYALIQ